MIRKDARKHDVPKFEGYFSNTLQLIKQGKLQQALVYIQDKPRPQDILYKCVLRLKQSHHQQYHAVAEALYNNHPDYYRGIWAYINSLTENFEFELVLDIIDVNLSRCPVLAGQFLIKKAYILSAKLGEHEEAEKIYQLAIDEKRLCSRYGAKKLTPYSIQNAYHRYAMFLENNHRYNEAEDMYKTIHEQWPSYWPGMFDYAIFLQKRNDDYNFSITVLQAVLDNMDPTTHQTLMRPSKRNYAAIYNAMAIANGWMAISAKVKKNTALATQYSQKATSYCKRAINIDQSYAAAHSTNQHLRERDSVYRARRNTGSLQPLRKPRTMKGASIKRRDDGFEMARSLNKGRFNNKHPLPGAQNAKVSYLTATESSTPSFFKRGKNYSEWMEPKRKRGSRKHKPQFNLDNRPPAFIITEPGDTKKNITTTTRRKNRKPPRSKNKSKEISQEYKHHNKQIPKTSKLLRTLIKQAFAGRTVSNKH